MRDDGAGYGADWQSVKKNMRQNMSRNTGTVEFILQICYNTMLYGAHLYVQMGAWL